MARELVADPNAVREPAAAGLLMVKLMAALRGEGHHVAKGAGQLLLFLIGVNPSGDRVRAGMREFDPSRLSQAVTQPERVGTFPLKLPCILGVSCVCPKSLDSQKTATLPRISRKSPAQTAEIPVFGETIGGDWFAQH